MIYLGIVIGMVIVLAVNLLASVSVGRRQAKTMELLMIEGNRLRFERNKILDRIADNGGVK